MERQHPRRLFHGAADGATDPSCTHRVTVGWICCGPSTSDLVAPLAIRNRPPANWQLRLAPTNFPDAHTNESCDNRRNGFEEAHAIESRLWRAFLATHFRLASPMMSRVLDSICEESPPLTVADIAARFGPMPLWRIRTDPAPGTATEADVLRIFAREKRLCELVDGILVEKAVGFKESLLAVWISTLLNNYVRRHRLGFVAGADGMFKIAPHLVRIPDVSFVARTRVPGGKCPEEPVPRLAPNLAVEVLSASNTRKEMRLKLREYFKAGVELVWFVDLISQTVEVFTAPHKSIVLKNSQSLDGGSVLPGFKVKLCELFADS
ncbi:MAG: Uma2 family endonuclease [Planctomycetales bacterium]